MPSFRNRHTSPSFRTSGTTAATTNGHSITCCDSWSYRLVRSSRSLPILSISLLVGLVFYASLLFITNNESRDSNRQNSGGFGPLYDILERHWYDAAETLDPLLKNNSIPPITEKEQKTYMPVDCRALLYQATEESNEIRQTFSKRNSAFRNRTGDDDDIVDLLTPDMFKNAFDPNLGKIYERETVIEPKFHISLHNQQFDPVRWTVYTKGKYYEFAMTDHFREILGNENEGGHGQKDNVDEVVVDVGMNVGWFTLLARAMGKRVISFDPNPVHHVRVCESLKLNGWDHSKETFNNGAAEDVGTVDNWPTVEQYNYGVGDVSLQNTALQYCLTRSGSASIRGGTPMRCRYKVERTVEVLTLDSFAKQEGWLREGGSKISIPLLKIDVESFEPQVFSGARKILRAGIVENILAEFSVAPRRLMFHSQKKTVELLLQSGYTLKLVGDWSGSGKKHSDQQYEGVLMTGKENVKNSDEFSSLVEDITRHLFDSAEAHKQSAVNTWWQNSSSRSHFVISQ